MIVFHFPPNFVFAAYREQPQLVFVEDVEGLILLVIVVDKGS